MSLTTLFTYLKIILLQYFQFSIFNFQQNKRYPNAPAKSKIRFIIKKKTIWIVREIIFLKTNYISRIWSISQAFSSGVSSSKIQGS